MHYWADIHVYIARTFPRLVLTIWFCTVKHAHICHDLTLSCTNMYAMCARMVRTKWQPSRLIYFPTLVRNPLNATFASMPAPQRVVWQDTFALFTHKSYCNSHCRIQVDYSFKCVPIEFKKWMNSNTKSLFVFYFGLFKLNLKTTKKKKKILVIVCDLWHFWYFPQSIAVPCLTIVLIAVPTLLNSLTKWSSIVRCVP